MDVIGIFKGDSFINGVLSDIDISLNVGRYLQLIIAKL
jgi:hypothetical protein